MPIDTHAHLFDEQFNDDLDEVIQRIKETKIKKVLVVGFSHDTNNKAHQLAQKQLFLPDDCLSICYGHS